MSILKNRVLKNAGWIVGGKIVQAIAHLFVTMISARYLGPSNYGLIDYAASVVAFLVPVMQLGLRNTLVQELVEQPEHEGAIMGTSLCLNVASSIACIIGVIGFASVANRGEPITIVVCAIYSLSLLFQAMEMIQYWFQAKLMSRYTSMAMLLSYLVIAAFKVWFLMSQKDIYWFACAAVSEYLLIALLLLILYRRAGGAKLSFSWELAKAMFAKSKYFILANMMVTIFAHTDRIMLKLMTTDAITGYYAAALVCANMTSFIFYAIIDSARPVIFESKKAGTEGFEKNVSLLYTVIIYFSLLQCLGITFFAPLIVRILYGSEYGQTVPMLRLVVWYSTFSHMGSVRNIWMLSQGLQRKLWKINLSGALANVVLNYVLIPVWGGMGAAFASLVTQFFTNVVMCFVMKPIRRCGTLLLRSLDLRPLLQLRR